MLYGIYKTVNRIRVFSWASKSKNRNLAGKPCWMMLLRQSTWESRSPPLFKTKSSMPKGVGLFFFAALGSAQVASSPRRARRRSNLSACVKQLFALYSYRDVFLLLFGTYDFKR